MDYNEELNCLVVYSVVRYFLGDDETLITFLDKEDAKRFIIQSEINNPIPYYKIEEVYIECIYEKE